MSERSIQNLILQSVSDAKNKLQAEGFLTIKEVRGFLNKTAKVVFKLDLRDVESQLQALVDDNHGTTERSKVRAFAMQYYAGLSRYLSSKYPDASINGTQMIVHAKDFNEIRNHLAAAARTMNIGSAERFRELFGEDNLTDTEVNQQLGLDKSHDPNTANFKEALMLVATKSIVAFPDFNMQDRAAYATLAQKLEKNKSAIAGVMSKNSSPKMSAKAFEDAIGTVIEFVRRIDSNYNIYASLDAEIDLTEVAKQLTVIHLSLENRKENAVRSGAESQEAKVLFREANKVFLDTLQKASKDGGLLRLTGSKPANKLIEETLTELLETGKTSPKTQRTTASKKPKGTRITKANSKASNNTKAKQDTVAESLKKFPPLRDASGRFQGLTNIKRILDSHLHANILKNMHRPNLINRTGRFASSVKVNRVEWADNRQSQIAIFYTYMKYPYQTFEPGFRQGHKGYDPRRLIEGSVRETLKYKVLRDLKVIRE